MNEREKIVAATVAGLAVIVMLFVVIKGVLGSFSSREALIEQLERKKTQQDLTIAKGKRAERELLKLQKRTLPNDVERSKAAYRDWLVDIAIKAGLKDRNVDPQPVQGMDKKAIYKTFPFSIKGQGSLEQIVTLLHEFYSRDLVHRIQSMIIKPLKKSDDLDLTLQVSALAMVKNPADAEIEVRPSDRLVHTREEYLEKILERNLFGPPNKPPEIATRSEKVYSDRPVAFSVRATDPERQRLTFALEKNDERDVPLPDARIDPRSGRVSAAQAKPGDYFVTVRVSDAGPPVKSSVRTLRVTVADPPPPPAPMKEAPKIVFDFSKHTYLEGLVQVDGRWQAWLHIRPTGEKLRLGAGDKLQVGLLEGRIDRVTERGLEVLTEKSRHFYKIGESLGEGFKEPRSET